MISDRLAQGEMDMTHDTEERGVTELLRASSEKEKAEELLRLLQGRGSERHAVVLQDFPDPDAISCAFGYKLLAESLGIETDLLYAGRISHQENLALINLLDITLIQWQGGEIPRGQYQGAVFLDNQGTTSRMTEFLERAGVPILAVVDHHVDQERLRPQFLDLRMVGASASIFTNYLQSGVMDLKDSRPEHRQLATALMHGIISDTGCLVHAKPFDFQAAAFLHPFVNPGLLFEILHQKRNHKVMEVIRIALANRVMRENFCLSGIGYLRSDDRDAIPQAADFLITEETVHTAIVYGVITYGDGREVIQGSLRTNKQTLAPDAFLKDALGRNEEGHFYGGGKSSAGGFEIPLGFLSGHDDPTLAEVKWEAFSNKIRHKFFQKIGVES
ncbi:MAG: bifunctional oligoribonuclease/PAP phosphatase NrnA [Magnetococcales bacterium]|nr:bifunctional oligoribonuclease/PAP phosphatase NrnA [Magnetococcales bacterium]